MGILKKGMRFVGPVVLPKVSQHRKLLDTYTHYFQDESVVENTVLYESRDGKSLTDSPFAIFQYLLKTDKEGTYTHIWTVTNGEELEKVKAMYQDDSRVLFVKRNSDEYLKWLTKAQYLINNSTFQPFVTIKDEQTYINTWHGTPLKTMGFDIPGNPADAKNVVRNFFMADYLISPNQHTTEMFLKNYRLNDNYTGKIIETGYPRIDQTWSKDRDGVLKLLFSFGVTLDLSKPIILYSPTCKMGDLAGISDEVKQIQEEMSVIRDRFGKEYNVLIKVHPFLYDKAKTNVDLKPYLIPDIVDTNQLLGVVDCLITDYSSIFFDFLVTDKPILFYCWDDDLYSHKRGKYFEYDELPGPVAFNIEELSQHIEQLTELSQSYAANYKAFKERFTAYDDGHVTSRVVDIIFNQKSLPDVRVIEPNESKKRLLIYPGGMRSNGITSSFLNLVQNIDYDKYNVVCFLDNINTPDQIKNVLDIPANVSLLFRFEASNYTVKEYYQDLNAHLHGVKKGKEDKYPEKAYQREIRRLLGKQAFDVAVDFSGYSLHWSKLILATPASVYNCYLHSDMKLDQERKVDGKKIHKMNLQGIFSVYSRYDSLISVSEAISKVNQEKLSDYAEADKFVYAPNVINIKKILEEPSEVLQKEVIDTEVFIRDGRVLMPEEPHMIRSSRPDSVLGSAREHYFTSDQVEVLGRFTYEGKSYIKVSQDHIYLGWLLEEHVEVAPTRVLSTKGINAFGKLNTRAGDAFYSQPVGLESSVVLSDAGDLRNMYVSFVKEVTTQGGTSYLVEIKGKEYGWLPQSKVTFSKKLNGVNHKSPNAVKKGARVLLGGLTGLSFSKQKKELGARPFKKESLEAYFYNKKNESLKGFKVPNKETESIDMGIMPMIYVKSLCVNSLGRWYEVLDTTDNVLWVEESSLSLGAMLDEVVVTDMPIYEEAKVKDRLVTVYATVEDALSKKGSSVQGPKEVTVIRRVKTSKLRELVLVEWSEKELWVLEEELEMTPKAGIINGNGEFFSYPSKESYNIVTTGRLSEEKNQVLLVEAFDLFRKEEPASHLYIIGAGPEEENIKKKISDLDLSKQVTLLGQVYYPFHFMRQCDLFALTSIYEGQSMVLLEALTLEMPCVSTDIPACRDVLSNGDYGILTETNDQNGFFKGMLNAKNEEKVYKQFNPYEYNTYALNKFYEHLDKNQILS